MAPPLIHPVPICRNWTITELGLAWNNLDSMLAGDIASHDPALLQLQVAALVPGGVIKSNSITLIHPGPICSGSARSCSSSA